ncbi:MAG: FAD-dependent oxidoreductase [Desulfobaccales bacterium]
MPTEVKVARVQDFQDGDMQEIALGETKIVLARVKGKFYAMAGTCTHYGGPLAEGALNGPRVVCPWHQAAFDLTTGALAEPPALDWLPCFTVRVEGDDVYITVPDKIEERRTPAMAKREAGADGRTFVILGAGAAGNAAAETLRQDGFRGRIVMITQEQRLPYDRPNLSKGYMSGEAGPQDLPWRAAGFYRDYDIEVLLGRRATGVNPAQQTVALADGPPMTYDTLLLATGAVPRNLEVPGAQLGNVFTLRTPEDTDKIVAAAASASRAVCLGAGFIGMEVAASLTKRGLAVTVVGAGPVPLARQLGPEIGRVLQQVHEEHGVAFRLGRRVTRLTGDDRVRRVVLDDGDTLDTDLVMVGLGASPATAFLHGLPLAADGSVPVDRYLQVQAGVYAAGDIARFPDWRTQETIRIEHWRLAEQHGRIAAHNMAGNKVAFTGVPFFWTDHFDQMLQYVGHVTAYDELIIHGELAARDFLAFYVKGHRVLAAAALQRDRQLAALAELMRIDQVPSPATLCREPGYDFVAALKALQA